MRNKISTGFLIIVILAGVAAAVLPSLLLGIGILWFITPVLGALIILFGLLRKKGLLIIPASLLMIVVGIAGYWGKARLTPQQTANLNAMGYYLDGQTYFLSANAPPAGLPPAEMASYRGTMINKALDAYIKSKNTGLDHPWVDYQIGYCYNYLAQHQQAFEVFSRLMRNPRTNSYATVLVNYAISAIKSGRTDIGEQAFAESIRQNKNAAYSYYQLGIHYRRSGDHEKAREYLEKTHSLGQSRSDASSILGSIAESLDEYPLADSMYRRAVSENRDNLTLYVKWGSMLQRVDVPVEVQVVRGGKKETLAALLRGVKARDLSSRDTKTYGVKKGVLVVNSSGNMSTVRVGDIITRIDGVRINDLSDFSRNSNRAEKVLLDGLEIAKSGTHNPREAAMLYNNLGFVYAEKGEISKSIAAFEQAMMTDYTFMDSYDNLAYLYMINNRPRDAVRVLSIALQVKPDHGPALRMMAQLTGVPDTVMRVQN